MAVINFEVFDGLVPHNTLFIHGNLASNNWWNPSVEIWRQKSVGKNFKGKIVTAEFRGCGKNPAPAPQDINVYTFANDFISLVKELNVGPFHLVGHSTGGLIAAIMMAQEPNLFKSAVLLDPVGARGVKFEESMTTAFEQMKKDESLVALVLGSTIHNNDAQSPFFKLLVDDAFHAVNTVGVGVIKSLANFDATDLLKKVTNPTLVLHGEHDLLLPMADSEALAKLMSNARFEIISGQGHCTNVEDPGKFVAITDRFLFS